MDIDDVLIPFVLHGHAVAGSVALFVAPLAMFAHKGGSWHRFWGKTFFYSMIGVCASAIFLAIVHPENFWLALVAVFSFHMIASGYRALYYKKLHQGQNPVTIDKWLHGIAGVVNGGLLIWGLSHFFMGVRSTQAILYTVFGVIGMGMVIMQFSRFYQRKHDRRSWWYGHMTGFLGGYIATLSAFSAVNLSMIHPPWLRWLWPTIIGTPLIILWTRYYKKQFASGKRARDFAEIRIR